MASWALGSEGTVGTPGKPLEADGKGSLRSETGVSRFSGLAAPGRFRTSACSDAVSSGASLGTGIGAGESSKKDIAVGRRAWARSRSAGVIGVGLLGSSDGTPTGLPQRGHMIRRAAISSRALRRFPQGQTNLIDMGNQLPVASCQLLELAPNCDF